MYPQIDFLLVYANRAKTVDTSIPASVTPPEDMHDNNYNTTENETKVNKEKPNGAKRTRRVVAVTGETAIKIKI